MQNIALSLIVVSIFGLISCTPDNKSSNGVEKVVIASDEFKLPQPILLSASDKKTQQLNAKITISKPLSIFDEIEFEISQVSQWVLKTHCRQNQHIYENNLELSLKPRFFLYEFLPHPLIQKMENQEILCNWELTAKNFRNSTYLFNFKQIKILPSDWSSQLKILNLTSKVDLYKNAHYHTDELKQWLMILNPEIQNDEVSIQCQGLEEIKGPSYQMEIANLPWEKWLKKIEKKIGFKTPCRVFTWHKKRITSWSTPFYIYNPKINFPPPVYLKRDKNSLLKFQINNPYPKDVYLRIYKQEFKRAFLLIHGFSIISSRLISSDQFYEKLGKNKLWMSTNQIADFHLSTTAKLVETKPTFWLYKLTKNSKNIFQIKMTRKPACKNIFIESTEFIKTNNLVLDILSDLNNEAQVTPLRRLTMPNLQTLFLNEKDSTNPSLVGVFMGSNSMFGNQFTINPILNKNTIINIKKNYDPNFNCQKGIE